MKTNTGGLPSAQVVLRPAGEPPLGTDTVITSENLSQFVPSQGTWSSTAEVFRASGFEVGPFVGLSFSITGTVELFESFFRMKVRPLSNGALQFTTDDGPVGNELLSGDLPESVRANVYAVTFPPPPDFGPTSF